MYLYLTLIGISRTTTYRVIHEYKAKGFISPPLKRSGRKSVLSTFDDTVKCMIRRNVHVFFYNGELPTLNKILKKIKEDENIPSMSRSTLYKLMKKLNFK